MFSGACIVFYRNGFILVLEDSTLSVSGAGGPAEHSLGWGMGGVQPCQISKVRTKGKC